MPKKMKFPFLFKNIAADTRSSSSSWSWPLCNQPRTLSFRTNCGSILKTINSAYVDAPSETQTPKSLFTDSSESASYTTASGDEETGGGDLTETVIRGLRSERLFFEPGETNSILEEAKVGESAPFKESLVMSLESRDPYADFKESMEEMVEAHGIKEWDDLEELLGWYLSVNDKQNHEYIVGAFIDLLVGLAITDNSISTSLHLPHQDSPSSLSLCTSFSSSSSTPCVSSSLEAPIQEMEEEYIHMLMLTPLTSLTS